MNSTLHFLTFQGSGDNDDDQSDFTDLDYYLQDKLVPPISDPDENLFSSQKAKRNQDLLDNQIETMLKDKHLINVLNCSVSNRIPCPPEHKVHVSRVLEIIIEKLQLPTCLSIKSTKSCTIFKAVPAPSNPNPASNFISTPCQKSQLNFSQGMLEVKSIKFLLMFAK